MDGYNYSRPATLFHSTYDADIWPHDHWEVDGPELRSRRRWPNKAKVAILFCIWFISSSSSSRILPHLPYIGGKPEIIYPFIFTTAEISTTNTVQCLVSTALTVKIVYLIYGSLMFRWTLLTIYSVILGFVCSAGELLFWIICVKQPTLNVPLGDPLRQVWLYKELNM